MNIIRGATIQDVVILSQEGVQLQPHLQQGFDLIVENECKKAKEEGRQEGERIGYEKVYNEQKLLIQLLQTLTQKLLDEKKSLYESMKPEIIELVMKVCEQILRKELSHPDAMIRHINTLLSFVETSLQKDVIRISVSPDDRVMLENYLNQANVQKPIEIQWLSDPLMSRGDCRIEMNSGLLNYTLSRELHSLQAKILQ